MVMYSISTYQLLLSSTCFSGFTVENVPGTTGIFFTFFRSRCTRLKTTSFEISSCENLDPIGNLRDFDWDFQKLWLSPAMKERRKKALDGCFCTHESNSYYPSLPFNPGHLIQIKKLEREMKKARKLIDDAGAPDGVAVRA